MDLLRPIDNSHIRVLQEGWKRECWCFFTGSMGSANSTGHIPRSRQKHTLTQFSARRCLLRSAVCAETQPNRSSPCHVGRESLDREFFRNMSGLAASSRPSVTLLCCDSALRATVCCALCAVCCVLRAVCCDSVLRATVCSTVDEVRLIIWQGRWHANRRVPRPCG